MDDFAKARQFKSLPWDRVRNKKDKRLGNRLARSRVKAQSAQEIMAEGGVVNMLEGRRIRLNLQMERNSW